MGDPTKWKSGFGKIIHMAPDFLNLVEEVECEIDHTFRTAGGLQGLFAEENGTKKEGKEKGRKLKELSGPRTLPITGKQVKSGWPTGYLYPIASAVRPLNDYSGDIAKWKFPKPMEIFNQVSIEMVKTLLGFAKEFGRKPNAVGKNQLLWKSLYGTIEVASLRSQAKH